MRRKRVNWKLYFIMFVLIGVASAIWFHDFTPEEENVEVRLTYDQLQKLKK